MNLTISRQFHIQNKKSNFQFIQFFSAKLQSCKDELTHNQTINCLVYRAEIKNPLGMTDVLSLI